MSCVHEHIATTYSIELTPKSLARVPDLRELLPHGTRVYLAHLPGTDFATMLQAAKRVQAEGFEAMPHLPVRMLPNADELTHWVKCYRHEAGVRGALVIAGGLAQPIGPFADALSVLRTGVFDQHGFTRLHLAAHPEGHAQMDPGGGHQQADQVLLAKQAHARNTDAQLALVTQFGFDGNAMASWCQRIEALGVLLPVHIGLAGPTRVMRLLQYAVQCGVGTSLRVLQQRAADLRHLVRPFDPQEVMTQLSEAKAAGLAGRLEQWHVFALGGVPEAAQWFNHALQLEPAARAPARLSTASCAA